MQKAGGKSQERMAKITAQVTGLQNEMDKIVQPTPIPPAANEIENDVQPTPIPPAANDIGNDVQPTPIPPAANEEPANQTSRLGVRVNWNDICAGSKVQIETDQNQEATDTNDLTVDKWCFKQSCWDASVFAFNSELMTCPESLYNLFLLVVNLIMQGLGVN
jgi:hypothetical protein